MIATLLAKLPELTAADLGWKVTVCIAVLCDDGKSIVQVTDRKVSFGTAFSADDSVLKDVPFFAHYTALVAGDDVEHATPILERAREILYSRGQFEETGARVADGVDQAFGERLHQEIERRILRKRGFTIESFREKGRQLCTPAIYLDLCSRIDRVHLSLRFLVCGFDPQGQGHIFCVDGEGAPKCYDGVGMWAIGTGAPAALSSLAFHRERHHFVVSGSEEEASYFAMAAKFMAESSGDVGKGTFMVVHRKETARFLGENYEAVRAIWEKEGQPRCPANLKSRMNTLLTVVITRSAPETSEQRP